MKKILITTLFAIVLVPPIALAEIKKESKTKEASTKMEAFLSKKGKLIVKNTYMLGEVSGRYGAKIKFDAMVLFEPGHENQKIRGIKIEVFSGDKYEQSDISFLDLEEIESLSDAIKYMSDLLIKWEGIDKEYTEVIFSTKDDFKTGFYQQGTDSVVFASSGYMGKASCYFVLPADLKSLKTLIDKGLKLLRDK